MESSPQFEVYYVYVVYSANVVSCVLGSIDGGFAYTAFMISCIFRMIQYDIEELFMKYGEKGDSYVMRDRNELCRLEYGLKVLIRRQIDTEKLAANVLKLFGVMIFVHFFTSAITICSVCVVILMGAKGIDLVSCLFYLSAISVQLFIYCYGATLVEEEVVFIHFLIFFNRVAGIRRPIPDIIFTLKIIAHFFRAPI